MKINNQLLLNHVSFHQFTMECQSSLNKLTCVISRNLRKNREDHTERSSRMDKGIKKIRQKNKISANTNLKQKNASSFFNSHFASRQSAQ